MIGYIRLFIVFSVPFIIGQLFSPVELANPAWATALRGLIVYFGAYVLCSIAISVPTSMAVREERENPRSDMQDIADSINFGVIFSSLIAPFVAPLIVMALIGGMGWGEILPPLEYAALAGRMSIVSIFIIIRVLQA